MSAHAGQYKSAQAEALHQVPQQAVVNQRTPSSVKSGYNVHYSHLCGHGYAPVGLVFVNLSQTALLARLEFQLGCTQQVDEMH